MDTAIIPMAFLFLLLLVINAAFTLGVAVFAFWSFLKDLAKGDEPKPSNIPTGVFEELHDHKGRPTLVPVGDLRKLEKEDERIRKEVEAWTLTSP